MQKDAKQAILIVKAEAGWVNCPACARKGYRNHLLKLRPDSSGENIPRQCSRCKSEYLLKIECGP